jgi:hypothetical protein
MQKQSKQNNNILDSQNNISVDENDKINEEKQEEDNSIVNLNYISIGYEYHSISLLSLNLFPLIFLKVIIEIIGPNVEG